MSKAISGWERNQRNLVRKLIGDYPIVDAKVAFRSTVLPQDIKGAAGKDVHHCAIARSVGRITGMRDGIAIFHKTAYAPFDKKGDGKIVVERFIMDSATVRAVEEFDKTGKFSPGEYVFKAPSKSRGLAAQRKTAKKHAARKKKDPMRWNTKPRVSMLGGRNGTGQIYKQA